MECAWRTSVEAWSPNIGTNGVNDKWSWPLAISCARKDSSKAKWNSCSQHWRSVKVPPKLLEWFVLGRYPAKIRLGLVYVALGLLVLIKPCQHERQTLNKDLWKCMTSVCKELRHRLTLLNTSVNCKPLTLPFSEMYHNGQYQFNVLSSIKFERYQ